MHVQYDLGFLFKATQRVKERYLLSIATCQLGLQYNQHIQSDAV